MAESPRVRDENVWRFDSLALKQRFGKKLLELEDEKRVVQQEKDRLLADVESFAASDGQVHKSPDIHCQKLKSLEAQIFDFKKKQENQVQLLKQKQRSEESAKKLQDEIQFIKVQKSFENMVSISSTTLVAMASQLSEAEEREFAFASRGRWNQLPSMGDAKNFLQYVFNIAADARNWHRRKLVRNIDNKQESSLEQCY